MVRGFVDTTTWVYLRRKQDAIKGNAVRAWIEPLAAVGDLVTNRQVGCEFYADGLKQRIASLDLSTLRADARDILVFAVREIDDDDFERARSIESRYPVQHWDVLFLATAQKAGCTNCLTEGLNPGQKCLDVTAVNPFTTTPDAALRP